MMASYSDAGDREGLWNSLLLRIDAADHPRRFYEIPNVWKFVFLISQYDTWRLIIMSTKAHHWTLFWASWIHFISPHPVSFNIYFNIYSLICVGLPSGLFSRGLLTKILCNFLFPWRMLCAPPISSSLIQSP
jgi:hypothetical protein